MKKNQFSPFVLKHYFITSLLIVYFSILLDGCTIAQVMEPTLEPSETLGHEITNEQATITASPTPTPILYTPTSTPTKFVDINDEYYQYSKIRVTQGPVIVSTGNVPDSIYLYKDVIVKFQMTEMQLALQQRRFLNLDDLDNNNANNSDILINLSSGAEGYRSSIFPVNYAKYFYSGSTEMDYAACVSQFPLDVNYGSSEDNQDVWFGTGNPYCILTNEGRIAIIQYIKNSYIANDEGIVSFSILISVYQKKAMDIFTPGPTETPGTSPTPTNKYSSHNLSDDQATILDGKVQDFITAVARNDEDSILQMISYPIYISMTDNREFTIYSSQEFLNLYDEVFTDKATFFL